MPFAWQCDPREQLEHRGSLKDGEEGDPATWLEGQRVPAGLHTVCLSPTPDNKHKTGPLIYSTHTLTQLKHVFWIRKDWTAPAKTRTKSSERYVNNILMWHLVVCVWFQSQASWVFSRVMKLPMCAYLCASESERVSVGGSEVKHIGKVYGLYHKLEKILNPCRKASRFHGTNYSSMIWYSS